MTTPETRRFADVGRPDIGFQAGFGFYLGLVVTGIVAVAGLLAGADTATLLGVLPSTVTFVALIGHILARRAHGLPERIGESRRRRLACFAPALAFGAPVLVAAATPIDLGARFVVIASALTVLTGVAGLGIAQMSRSRYIDAVTDDEPSVTWTWREPDAPLVDEFGDWLPVPVVEWLPTAIGAAMIVAGLGLIWVAGLVAILHGLIPVLWGASMLVSNWTDWGDDEAEDEVPDDEYLPELQVHDVGLVRERYDRKLVPWGSVEGVRLTEDELVIERRWSDIRCARAEIDDPEAVFEEIERARNESERARASRRNGGSPIRD